MSIAWYEIYICNLKWDWTNIKMGQGWEFTNSIIAHLLICSKSLILMSDYDRLIQITQDKWATVSESLRLLILSFAHKKREIHSKNFFEYNHVFMYVFKKCFASCFFLNGGFAHSLFFGERCMWIAQITHDKRANWANRSGQKMSKWANC